MSCWQWSRAGMTRTMSTWADPLRSHCQYHDRVNQGSPANCSHLQQATLISSWLMRQLIIRLGSNTSPSNNQIKIDCFPKTALPSWDWEIIKKINQGKRWKIYFNLRMRKNFILLETTCDGLCLVVFDNSHGRMIQPEDFSDLLNLNNHSFLLVSSLGWTAAVLLYYSRLSMIYTRLFNISFQLFNKQHWQTDRLLFQLTLFLTVDFLSVPCHNWFPVTKADTKF